MKNLLFFVLGMVSACLIICLISLYYNSNDLILFSEKGNCITRKQLTVFQVLEPNAALAYEGDFFEGMLGAISGGVFVLLVNDEGKYYYDGEKIKIPSKKCARQIGTYQYLTKEKSHKTIPVVNIE